MTTDPSSSVRPGRCSCANWSSPAFGMAASSSSIVPVNRSRPKRWCDASTPPRRRRAFHQLVGDDEDLMPGQVDHRRAGDADPGRDVTTRQVVGRDRRRQVARPEDVPAVGGHHVDGVVLGRRHDPALSHERLAEELPVERWRRPRRPAWQERRARRVEAGVLLVPVVARPVGPECPKRSPRLLTQQRATSPHRRGRRWRPPRPLRWRVAPSGAVKPGGAADGQPSHPHVPPETAYVQSVRSPLRTTT